MMGGRWLSYLNTAAFIIETYNGSTPLVHHLKHYFAQFKKHGSKDRKYISHACYCYFRLGKSIENITIVDQLKIGLFLCNNDPKQWENVFDENWITEWSKPIQQKNVFVQQYYPELNIEKIFLGKMH
jgi:16S rRNA (cytosine967-C5)-methyltransferase